MTSHGWIGLATVAAGLGIVGMSLLGGGADRSPGPRGAAAPVVAAASPAPAPAVAAAAPAAPAPARDERFVIKRILPIDGPLRYGAWHWDEAGAPADGPLVITVDLEARVLSVFRGGYEIAATAVLLGTTEKPTPTGVFPITEKDADHTSNIYDGAPMPYMMRLTNDGVSIHGTTVQNGYASHGCVGVPTPFARKLFAIAARGTPVYITRGKMVGLGDSLTG
ncbi:L,D-transpeptidase family protein [Novosphingobium piscinae]|uniref:L,D-transpeptidase family protein n=1 Tax=Novosphingobium piscinae TaxID=1507448 RepID=A0A7X1G175_9SPHN|nr:L,D-transpeptidase family protein [Novosphingobium piscinae]MBC2670774.1 L,D-transpeptidase family protein [Novosphingobium piscinae]